MIKKKIAQKKVVKEVINLEDRQGLIKKIVEDSQKQRYVTYESVMDASDKYKFNEDETNQLLKELEKKNVELILQEELTGSSSIIQDEDFIESLDEKEPAKIANKLSKKSIVDEEEEIEEDGDEDKDEG